MDTILFLSNESFFSCEIIAKEKQKDNLETKLITQTLVCTNNQNNVTN